MIKDFIELDLLFKSEEEDRYQALGINVDSDKFEVSSILIRKSSIDAIHPYDYADTTLIYTKDNVQFLVRHSYDEIKDLLFGE